MNALIEQINSTGKTFIDFALPMLMQSSALIVILLALDMLLRKRIRAVFRYWIWMIVLVKLILPPSLSLPTSPAYWFGDKIINSAQKAPIQEEPVTYSFSNLEIASPSNDFTPTMYRPEPVFNSEELVAPPPVIPKVPLSWQAVAFLSWLSLSLIMFILLIQRTFFVKRLINQSQNADEKLNNILEQARLQMSLKKKVVMRLSNTAMSPSVCGLFKPVILIPQKLVKTISSNDFKAILLHELAHIKRNDLWVNLVQAILQIIYIYNPLLWIANIMIRNIREQAVDEMVLVAMGEHAEEYPKTLLNISRLSFGSAALSLRLIGVAESKKALITRIKHITSRPFPKTVKLGITGLTVIILAAFVLLPMAKAEKEENTKDTITISEKSAKELTDGVTDTGLEKDTIFEKKPVYFADPNLKAAVENELDITNPNTSDMLNLKKLSANEKGITNLTGLEYAANLEVFSAFTNKISDINPISNLTNLKKLDLRINQIKDISPLKNLTNLEELMLEANQIVDISSLAGMKNLEDLWIPDNQISDISPLSSLIKLKNINLSRNQIVDISTMKNLTNLKTISLFSNKISDINPLSGLTILISLNLSNNQIRNVGPLSNLMNLESLILNGNHINDISQLSGMTKLTGLSASNNNIIDTSPFSNLSNLNSLNLSNNKITDFSPLTVLTNLGGLDLSSNQIEDIGQLTAMTKLIGLSLGSNKISNIEPLSGLTNLQSLGLENNNIKDINSLSGMTKLYYLNLRANPLSNDAYYTYLEKIKINNPDLTKIVLDFVYIPRGLYYDSNPNSPSGVSATKGTHPNKVQISYDPVCSVAGDTYYQIYRADSVSGAKTVLNANWQKTTVFEDKNVTSGKVYYYWIKAKTQDSLGKYGETDYSAYATGFYSQSP